MNIFSPRDQEILERLSRHCPEAISTYIQCINRQDIDHSVFFTRKTVEEDMSESFCVFKNNLKKLCKENLLEWHPIQGGIVVTLAEDEQ